MDNIFDLELPEFRENNHSLDGELTGLSNISNLSSLSLPSLPEMGQTDQEEMKALSSKVLCLEQQLGQVLQTVSYCFDMISQFQAMNTKFQTFEKTLNSAVSDVANLKRHWRNQRSLRKRQNQPELDPLRLSEESNVAFPGLDSGHVRQANTGGTDSISGTRMHSTVLDTQIIDLGNVGDTSKIPDSPEAAAVPICNEDTEKEILNTTIQNGDDPKNDTGIDIEETDNFDYADYELNTSTEDDLGNHPDLTGLGTESKEIQIDDIELDDMEPAAGQNLYSTIALDDLVKFGLRPRNARKAKTDQKQINLKQSDARKLRNGISKIEPLDEEEERTQRATDPCKICGKVLARRNEMKRHMRTHSEKTGFPCPDCGKHFTRKDGVQKHLKQNRCSKLDQARYQIELLEGRRATAMENNTPEQEDNDCEMCNKVFGSRKKLKEHCRIVHDMVKNFSCTTCGKTFYRKCNLNSHVLKHEKDAPCRCETCGRVFARFFDLARHEKSHYGIKEFKCDDCGEGFIRRDGLAKHRRIHEKSEDKIHVCDQCGASFKELRMLTKHKSSNHKSDMKHESGSLAINRAAELESQSRQQLRQLKNIMPNGDKSPSYQLFDPTFLPSLEDTFGGDSLQ